MHVLATAAQGSEQIMEQAQRHHAALHQHSDQMRRELTEQDWTCWRVQPRAQKRSGSERRDISFCAWSKRGKRTCFARCEDESHVNVIRTHTLRKLVQSSPSKTKQIHHRKACHLIAWNANTNKKHDSPTRHLIDWNSHPFLVSPCL